MTTPKKSSGDNGITHASLKREAQEAESADELLAVGLKSAGQVIRQMRKQPVEMVTSTLEFLAGMMAVLAPKADAEGREAAAKAFEDLSQKQKQFLLDLAKEVNRTAISLMEFQFPKVARIEHIGERPSANVTIQNKFVVALRTAPMPEQLKIEDRATEIDLESDDIAEHEVGLGPAWAKGADDERPN